jgi:hypothetical protein
MLFGSKTQAYPVPGPQFNKHKLFMEIKSGDTEDYMLQLCNCVNELIAIGAATKGVKVVRTVNSDPLSPFDIVKN